MEKERFSAQQIYEYGETYQNKLFEETLDMIYERILNVAKLNQHFISIKRNVRPFEGRINDKIVEYLRYKGFYVKLSDICLHISWSKEAQDKVDKGI